MKYSSPETGPLFVWAGVALLFIGIGVYIARTPAERILQWDRQTGYWLYHRELKASGDKKRALAKAGYFYWAFGIFFSAFAALHLLVVSTILVIRLLSFIFDSP